MTDRREKQRDGGFAARLREVVDAYGSTAELARQIERSEGAVRKWLRGESEPDVTDLRALCQETQTRIEWLATGAGDRQAGLAVREAPATYQAGGARRPVLEGLLADIMRAVDRELEHTERPLAPERRSQVVAALYTLCQERGQVDGELVSLLVRLVE
jgi:transcriptional regulator with XRE-family HTH domain